jgi:hypothetical protein
LSAVLRDAESYREWLNVMYAARRDVFAQLRIVREYYTPEHPRRAELEKRARDINAAILDRTSNGWRRAEMPHKRPNTLSSRLKATRTARMENAAAATS